MEDNNNSLNQLLALDPALFCLLVQPLALQLQSDLKVWYLDDATFGDTPEAVHNLLSRLMEGADKLGLKLNFNKCEIMLLGHSEKQREDTIARFENLAPGIRPLLPKDFTLQGAA